VRNSLFSANPATMAPAVKLIPRPVLSRRSQPSSDWSQVGEFRRSPTRFPRPTPRRRGDITPLGFATPTGVFRRWGPLRVGTIWQSWQHFGRAPPAPRAGRPLRRSGSARPDGARNDSLVPWSDLGAGQRLPWQGRSVRLSSLTRPQVRLESLSYVRFFRAGVRFRSPSRSVASLPPAGGSR